MKEAVPTGAGLVGGGSGGRSSCCQVVCKRNSCGQGWQWDTKAGLASPTIHTLSFSVEIFAKALREWAAPEPRCI